MSIRLPFRHSAKQDGTDGHGTDGHGTSGHGKPVRGSGGNGTHTNARPVAHVPTPHRARSAYRTVGRPLLGLVAALVIGAASVVLVRLGNGDFAPSYLVTASFTSSSSGLHPGSQVEERGVQIGSIKSIELEHGEALVTMSIGAAYRLPSDSSATIEPQNLFGADQISISAPDRSSSGHVSLLTNGSRIVHTSRLDELGQLFATADPLLSEVDTADLARVVDELAAAYGGQGRRIAESLTAGTQLASLFSRTVTEQLAALDAFTRFSVSIEGAGPTLNELGYDGNQTLPLFNAARSAYAKLLSDLGNFGDRLSVLVQDYRPQINTILDSGGNVMRVVLAQQQNVVQLVQGLAMYAYRFAHGSSSAHLPDGSRMGYFKTFILWNDVNRVICGLLAPPVPGLSYLEPLQHAVLGNGSPLNCSSQIAAFDKAQGATVSPRTGTSGSGAPGSGGGSGTGPGGAAGGALRKLAKGIYGVIARPEPGPVSTSLGSYVQSLLGGLP